LAITETIVTDSRPLALLGESIGAGTVCAILADDAGSEATERASLPRTEGSGQPALPGAGAPGGARLVGAALVVPFARLIEVGWNHYGPLALLLRDRFDNIAALRSCRVPVAFVVAGEDEVVGAQQGHKLHASFTGPKLLIDLQGATHNGFTLGPDSEWVREVDAFLRGR
jgi:pimeloyl-ACP methyl ester carboxylesterase